jgi:hypothetical protein
MGGMMTRRSFRDQGDSGFGRQLLSALEGSVKRTWLCCAAALVLGCTSKTIAPATTDAGVAPNTPTAMAEQPAPKTSATQLAPSAPMVVEMVPATGAMGEVLSRKFGPPAPTYDETGEHTATWDAPVTGAPDVTAFVHGTRDGQIHVALVDSTDVTTVFSAPWGPFTVARLIAFAVPSRRDEFVICLADDCTLPGHCRGGRFAQRERQCAWLAPNCEQPVGAALTPRFGRVDHKARSLLAEVFIERLRCLPRDEANPQWGLEANAPRTDWVLRGELDVPGCAVPTWKKVTDVLAWSGATREPEVVPLEKVPRCDGPPGAGR